MSQKWKHGNTFSFRKRKAVPKENSFARRALGKEKNVSKKW